MILLKNPIFAYHTRLMGRKEKGWENHYTHLHCAKMAFTTVGFWRKAKPEKKQAENLKPTKFSITAIWPKIIEWILWKVHNYLLLVAKAIILTFYGKYSTKSRKCPHQNRAMVKDQDKGPTIMQVRISDFFFFFLFLLQTTFTTPQKKDHWGVDNALGNWMTKDQRSLFHYYTGSEIFYF